MNATELQGFPIATTAPNTGQALVWNGSLYVPTSVSNTPTGPAGGDLSGTYPNPIVAGIQSIPVITVGGGVGSFITLDGGPTRWGLTPPPPANLQSPIWNSSTALWGIDYISQIKDFSAPNFSRPINGDPRSVGNVLTFTTDPDTGTFGWNAQPPTTGIPPGASSGYTALTSPVAYTGGANLNLLAINIVAGIWLFTSTVTLVPTSSTAFDIYFSGSVNGPLAGASNFMQATGQDVQLSISAAFNLAAQTMFMGIRCVAGINASVQNASAANGYGGATSFTAARLA